MVYRLSALLLIVGIVIGVLASKYLQVFDPSVTTGTLIATVMRSPTCPGAQEVGENCSAPVTNETFNITRLSDNRIIQSVRTDKDGKFTISLAVGNYKLQSSTDGVDKFGRTGGIGNIIDNPNFTITSGKTTTQQFDIDTGIR